MPIARGEDFQKPDQLLSMLAANLSERSLFYIAAHDRGTQDQLKRHLEELNRVRSGNYFIDPKAHNWYPLEVIVLASWSEWDEDLHQSQDISLHDFHSMRAFCCSIMLYIAGQHAYDDYLYTGDRNEALIQLVNSIDMLPDTYIKPAFDFLMWRMADPERCNDLLAYLAISAIYLHFKASEKRDDLLLESLAEIAITAERNLHKRIKRSLEPGWLIPVTGSQLTDSWKSFFSRLASSIIDYRPDMTSNLYELSVQLGA